MTVKKKLVFLDFSDSTSCLSSDLPDGDLGLTSDDLNIDYFVLSFVEMEKIRSNAYRKNY